MNHYKRINYIILNGQSHEFDECRFDVAVNNCVWYLRAETPEDKTHWIDVLQSYKVPVGVDMTSLMRYGSTISLQTNSTTFNQSSNNGGLREKINEIETLKDTILNQIRTLQHYFDLFANAAQKRNSVIDVFSDLKTIDLEASFSLIFFFFL